MTNYFHLLSIGLIIGLSLVSCSKDSAPNFHRLSVITTPSEGGTVTPGSGEYEEGTEIELTAKPNEDWALKNCLFVQYFRCRNFKILTYDEYDPVLKFLRSQS